MSRVIVPDKMYQNGRAEPFTFMHVKCFPIKQQFALLSSANIYKYDVNII